MITIHHERVYIFVETEGGDYLTLTREEAFELREKLAAALQQEEESKPVNAKPAHPIHQYGFEQ